jgi:hypothetical protein
MIASIYWSLKTGIVFTTYPELIEYLENENF